MNNEMTLKEFVQSLGGRSFERHKGLVCGQPYEVIIYREDKGGIKNVRI